MRDDDNDAFNDDLSEDKDDELDEELREGKEKEILKEILETGLFEFLNVNIWEFNKDSRTRYWNDLCAKTRIVSIRIFVKRLF